jgi:hypothetical protein
LDKEFYMKIIAFLVSCSFLICFPVLGFAKDELVMQKEVMYWTGTKSDTPCSQLINIELGRDVSDIRDELCGSVYGKFNLTLSGPPGTTVTLFGEYNFKEENGFLVIRKTDDQTLWLHDLISFPPNQWFSSQANKDSGAFETFYNSSPTFEDSVSSIKWSNNVQ